MAKFKEKQKKEQVQETEDMKSEDQELELEGEVGTEIDALQKMADDSEEVKEIEK
jgi:hypothetical protein